MRAVGLAVVALACGSAAAKEPCHQYCKAIESPCNEVVCKPHGYQIRKYATDRDEFFTDAYVKTGSFLKATAEGFNMNFAYISGKNSANATIPMTAPVIFRYCHGRNATAADVPPVSAAAAAADGDSSRPGAGWHVGFFVPSKYETKEDIPTPEVKNVTITAVPSGATFAVSTFGGFARAKDFAKQTRRLYHRLRRDNVTVHHDEGANEWGVVWAAYDSPFVLFNRHNEVWLRVDVDSPEAERVAALPRDNVGGDFEEDIDADEADIAAQQ
jgi:hypothetical protein